MAHTTSKLQEGRVLHSEFDCLWKAPNVGNVTDYVLKKIKQHSDKGRLACVENGDTGETLTYANIEENSRKIASRFYKLGLRAGDTVIYSTHSPAKVHTFMLGVWRANGIVRSSYPEDVGDTLKGRILESRAKFFACDASFAEEANKVIRSIDGWKCNLIVFHDGLLEERGNFLDFRDFYDDDGSLLPACTAKLDDVCLILPTSGTTGDSKGAVYTHRILLENVLAFECMPFTDIDDQPTIITSRQTHFVGCVVGLSFITKGRQLLTFQNVTVEKLLVAVDKYKVRSIVGFPKYLTGLVNHPSAGNYDLRSLHFLASAGQVIGPETLAIIKQHPNLKTFINLYGMTEAGLLVTTADWGAMGRGQYEAVPLKDYTVGKLPPKTSLKVVDIDSGKVVGANCRGELWFKTEVMVTGYLNKVEETQATFEDGWVKTGDVGYYDDDGYIFIVDRAKEIFKYYNNHISPSEIENLLLRHPAVAEAVVIGVDDPDGGGSIARGFVVLHKERNTAAVNDILNFTQNNLPPYKQLKGGLFVLPCIPVGKTGKVSRKFFSTMPLPNITPLRPVQI